MFSGSLLCARHFGERGSLAFARTKGRMLRCGVRNVEMRRPGPVERFFLKEYSAFHLLGQIEFFVIFIFVI
jgi:hypothetical protein